MSTETDYYAILGVAPGSEDIVIQAAYRALMRRYHPDKNPSAEAARKTIEINEAYAVLGDPIARAAYDGRRRSSAESAKAKANRPPPPPPPPPSDSASHAASDRVPSYSEEQSRGGLVFASILSGCIVLAVVVSAASSSGVANNTMNVDENLTTTDMDATDMLATDMNATDMSATDMNATAMNVDENLTTTDINTMDMADQAPPDLSRQIQTAVSYSTVEDAAKRVARMIVRGGMASARTYSENCHKAVQSRPSWDGADSCAAFDYAAAYIDGAVSNQGGWPKNGYFDFQSDNQSDDYSAVGAPSYVTNSRLTKVRSAAQSAAAEAFRAEIAKMRAQDGPGQPTPGTSDSNTSE